MAKVLLPFQDSVRPKASADETALRAIHVLGLLFLTVALALPLGSLLFRAFEDQHGGFVGLRNFAIYVTTPSLIRSAWNSIWTAALTTLVVVHWPSLTHTGSRGPACRESGSSAR